jgi:DNA-binding CsgD family transcriptional regulator
MYATRSLQYESIFSEILAEPLPLVRWQKFVNALADIGFDQINYGFLDVATAHRMEARCDPALTTMRADWIRHYGEQRYDLSDHVLAHVRDGKFVPKRWNEAPASGTRAFKAYEEACEAGLKSGLLIPLAGPLASNLPGAAIMVGSSLSEREFSRIMKRGGNELLSLCHLFHAGAVGELIRRRDQTQNLSPRERDILQFAARGLRIDEIADRVGLARVTVELHLRNVRKKLNCRTLAEAVARGMLYGDVSL